MKHGRLTGESAFTLVEMLVVVAIMGVLASVAVPAYINYINRTKQSEAAAMLMTARLEMEEFFIDNNRYAGTIQCLPSFVADANTACLRDCAGCTAASAKPKYYTFSVAQVTNSPAYYRIAGTRKIYSWAATDNIIISANTDTPQVMNTDALLFSVFEWIFE